MAPRRSVDTLVDLLRYRAGERHGQNAYTYLTDGEVESARWSYGELDAAARSIAARLQELAVPGDRALLLYPSGLDFVAAFFGCLYAGVIAVPAYPPRRHRVQRRLRSIAEDCEPAVCLTTTALAERAGVLGEQSPALAAARWLATDRLGHGGAAWTPPAVEPGTLAFLQYTSGSTGDPKGVMVSHAHLLHNEEMIRRAFGMDGSSVVVGWLPLYHDMGLIGNVLQPLYAGAPCVLMSPMAFLQKPQRWLAAIDRYRGTTSGGPDFAYELCADRIGAGEIAELDLSSWRVAFNGAEPVRSSTLERFAETFATCGFRREAFYPCYGLAETTLFVTGGDPGRGAVVAAFGASELEGHRAVPAATEEGARELVGCGRAWLGQEVAIVGEGRRLDDGAVGEIWVAGPSVAGGYWQRPELSRQDFEARLESEPEAGTFLRTGDLGFLQGGELFVTGRLKDLIILRGRNLYPQDLERTATACHPGLRPGGAIAFAVDEDGREELVLVLEVERRVARERDPAVAESLVAAVRRAIAAEHEAAVRRVVLISPGTLPKTSSGKVRRRACRRQYLAGELRTVFESPLADGGEPLDETADTPLERAALLALEAAGRRAVLVGHLRRVVARRLGLPADRVEAGAALTALGLDSLHAMELQGRLERELGVAPDLAGLLEGASLDEVAGEILERLASGAGEPIPATGEETGEHPLSSGQRALWFLHRLAPESAAYSIAAGARVRGALDAGALRRAFERLVERHSMLRARFRDPAGKPVLEVLPDAAGRFLFRTEDASGWGRDRVATTLDEEARRPFDLAEDALLRILLLRRGADEHLLLLVVHHVVADFWSLAVLLEELGEVYRAETGGPAAALPPLELSYPDFARWQNERLAGEEGRRLEAYWRGRLAGGLEPLDLATDRPRPPVQTWRGATVSALLPPAAAERLRALAAPRGATLYMTLLAGFQALLHRYTGQVDLAVGSPTAGRGRPELEGLVGYFVNPVVLRADLAGRPSFEGFLERTRVAVLDAFRHQAYPFDLLVERLQPERRSSRPPIFQVLFTLQQAPRLREEGLDAFALGRGRARLALGGLEWEPLPVDTGAAQLELALAAAVAPAGLALSLTYNRDLFERATAERLLGHLERLLDAAAGSPATRLGDLPLLTKGERRQVLVDWNDTRLEAGSARNLYELVAARAAHTPSAVALVSGDLQVRYGELLLRAGRVARRLRRLGVEAEEPVGLCLERSPEMIVGLLGILAAGGCYVPLDPAYPEDRRTYMFGDVTAGRDRRLLLTRKADRERLGALAGLATEVLIVEEAVGSDAPAGEPRGGRPGNLAYVIYTSGSTGRPKGVAVPHGAVVNFLESMRRAPGLGSGDALLAVTTLAFDIAVLEIFLPLTVGARLVLASRGAPSDGALLGAEIERHGVTAVQATPATWRLLLESGRAPKGLVRLCGGEALPADLAAGLLEQGGSLWNMYGPTETTIWSAARRVEAGEAPVKVGGAVANTRLHVLDGGLEAVPVGVPGEMWIAGEGLARGYRGRPRLTAERFLPDPFAAELGAAGDRLYRVGDRVRWLPDGTFEFLGRVDHQVKVRGYRIELGEIEATLNAQPAVAQGVVVVRADDPADPRLVAFLKAAGDAPTPDAELRSALRRGLPDYMMPSALVWIDDFPRTPNGKIDRKALIRRPLPKAGGAGKRLPRAGVERELAELWCEVLGVDSVGLDDNFFDVGGHSLLAARLHRLIVERLGRDDLTVVHLFQYPTLDALAGFLSTGEKGSRRLRPAPALRPLGDDIAIIGMAGRFPGAPDLETFWRNLRDGVESITFFDESELEDVDPRTAADPRYVPARGVLDEGEDFDAAYFGFTPREAQVMDPQHRVFLEVAHQALEDAGHDPGRYGGRIALYAGVGMNTYLLHAGEEQLASLAGGYQAFIANDKDFVPTRVSYKLDLRGPSVNVQTACSSSLVAVHLACQSLRTGESDMALAGGVTVRLPQRQGYLHEDGGILSPDGHCRAFDERGGGTVLGNGLGVVVLKPLAAARRDGDRVLALVKGSAINNDGALKMGYTAPSVEGQAEVLAAALARAGVAPGTVGYVEAHGTGTALGDPIEVTALRQVFARSGGEAAPCYLGSVKTNIGHLDTAAGIAGLIKTVLALQHGEIPPSLHFSRPNPDAPFEGSTFRVAAGRVRWPKNGAPRRAGVSSFGIGGTNAHVVLEEAPAESGELSTSPPWQLVTLSGRTPAALDRATRRLAEHLAERAASTDGEGSARELADVAFTLHTGRRAHEHRRFAVARDLDDAARVLGGADPERLRTGVAAGRRGAAAGTPPRRREPVFLFSGQGSQYPGMGRALYDSEPVFRTDVDRAAGILASEIGADLRRLLFPDVSDGDAARRLTETRVTQPALFAVEYALARLWEAWGVRPAAMIGHSVGELVAACLAGVFTFEDALRLVAARGRLMQERPAGAMLAVGLAEDEVVPLLGDELSLAVLNGPQDAVVAGPAAAVEALEARLAEDGGEIRHRRLHTSHAFHSTMMAPAVEPFVRRVAELRPRTPRIPFVSNVTGTWITDAQASDPAYWGRQLVETVRFADGLRTVAADREPAALLEVGPGHALATLARPQVPGVPAIASLPHPRDPEDARRFLLGAAGRLWQAGVEADWQAFYESRGEKRRRVALPTYPFERRRFWLERGERGPRIAAGDSLARKADVADWFYAPAWKPSHPPPAPEPVPGETWWLIGDPTPGSLTAGLAARLTAGGRRVETLAAGAGVDRRIAALGGPPARVVAAWPGDGVDDGLTTLLPLVQALAGVPGDGPVALDLVTRGAWPVRGGETPDPAAALLWGFLRAVPQELPRLRCRAVDLEEGIEVDPLLDDLVAELLGAPDGAAEVAWRGGLRWQRTFEPVRVPPAPAGEIPARLRRGGTYLVTGGLGGVGLALARGLVDSLENAAGRKGDDRSSSPAIRLALLGRTALPPRPTWEAPTAGGRRGAAVRRRIQAVRELEEAGAEVMTLAADVADRRALEAALAEVGERWGTIHGVIHAAGVAGGGLLRLRRPEEAEAVLRPKVDGTRNLLELLDSPDFLLLCSSINAVVGGYGQADYCAANAFLDAAAAAADDRRGRRVLSLGWDRWRGVGMAASPGGEGGHPLLGTAFFSSPEREIYRTRYAADQQWVLSEHLIAGRPTVPGAAYLEMARAALAERAAGRGIEIRDVVFLEPLAVDPGASREVLTVLDFERATVADSAGGDRASEPPETPGPAATFRVLSRADAGGEAAWSEHCRGHVAAVAPGPAPALDLSAVRERAAGRITAEDVAARSSRGFLVTGRRWQGLESVRIGDGELVVEVALDGDLAGDLDAYPLHPALLDVAVGCVQLAREGDFLPFSYDRLQVFGPLPGRLISHLTLRGGAEDAVTCDALLVDEEGAPRVRVEGFSMRRLAAVAVTELERAAAAFPRPGPDAAGDARRPEDAVLEGTLEPAEAVDVLRRVLAGRVPPHLVVSPRDLDAVRSAYADFDPARLLAELAEIEVPAGGQERPDLGTEFVAPQEGMEKVVAEVWQRYLGIDEIGTRDNFFELGGTSLVGVQVVGELKRRLDREIPTVSLFEAPTVAALAKLLEPPAETAPAFQRTRDRAHKKKAALSRRKRPPRRRARTTR